MNSFVKVENYRGLNPALQTEKECSELACLITNDHTIPIKKFGRYPHRNKVLGRISTEEENIFLNQPNSSW